MQYILNQESELETYDKGLQFNELMQKFMSLTRRRECMASAIDLYFKDDTENKHKFYALFMEIKEKEFKGDFDKE